MSTPAFDGIEVARGEVPADWIDVNDHMNVAYYVLAFDHAIDTLWARLGIDDDYVARARCSTFAVECHVTYQRELRRGDLYVVTMEVLAYDAKRVHHFQRMYHAGERYLAATAEWMSLHVDLDARRVRPWPATIVAELGSIAAESGNGGAPAELCGRMRVSAPLFARYAGAYA